MAPVPQHEVEDKTVKVSTPAVAVNRVGVNTFLAKPLTTEQLLKTLQVVKSAKQ